jgi:hypothetical protein
MFRTLSRAAGATAALALVAAAASAQHRSEIRFEAGGTDAYVEGSIAGQAYRDYALTASAGQTLSVTLINLGGATSFFNILPPGSDGAAIYNGSVEGEMATITLPEDGSYVVRVYLMGEARDADGAADYGLSVTIL